MRLALERLGYRLLWWLGLPLVAAYLLYRSLRQPEYRAHWGERFLGRGPVPVGEGERIWVHAVSVGETRAAAPLIEALARAHPRARFVLTHMSPTGRAAGTALAQTLAGRLVQRYLPYELGFAQRRFLRELKPRLGILMETEIWPNLLLTAQAEGVPMVLANARLSAKSLARADRLPALLRAAAATLGGVAAQSEADRQRIATAYGGPLEVFGNLKFDLTPDPAQIAAGRALRATAAGRPIILLASTREGEESLLLRNRGQTPIFLQEAGMKEKLGSDPYFCVVPRHPQRFEEVARLAQARGWRVRRRSEAADFVGMGDDELFLGDSMGEMVLYYASADVALIGGSVLPFGAQNLIEACAVGTPVVLGPSTFNFAQAAQDALAAGAAAQVADADAALTELAAICADPARRARMSTAALAFAHAHRGATARTAAWLERWLIP
ncbi:MAG: 3-deoxy-D-manno-octulosonic acid transferase [Betaproteobacteria bacterium]